MQNASFDIVCAQIGPLALAVLKCKKPPTKSSRHFYVQSHVCGKKKPLIGFDEILHGSRGLRGNHLCKFL